MSASAVVNHHTSVSTLEAADDMSAELRSTMDALADTMLKPNGETPSVSQVMRSVGNKLNVEHAIEKIEKKNLPSDVVALVKAASTKEHSTQPFSEASLDKARVALNGLVEASWKELDDKIIECKEFEEQNRGTFDQVTTDISRLVEQISDLQRIESESINGIAATEQQIEDVEASLAEEKKVYDQIYAVNNAEMIIRQNDLDVFTFILFSPSALMPLLSCKSRVAELAQTAFARRMLATTFCTFPIVQHRSSIRRCLTPKHARWSATSLELSKWKVPIVQVSSRLISL